MEINKQYIIDSSTPITETGCWAWLKHIGTNGYGSIRVKNNGIKSNLLAHRLSFIAFYGPISDALLVCHRCDNRWCVNPGHLFAGSHKENMMDCKRKDRHVRRERNGRAKLTSSDVLLIRKSSDTFRALACRYGVSSSTISDIKTRKRWGSLSD